MDTVVSNNSAMNERMQRIRAYSLDQPATMLSSVSAVESEASAAVVSNAIIAFVAGMSPQNKKDVQNSFLFATLAANNQYNANQQSESWYRLFLEVMTDLGWVTARRSYSDYRVTDRSFTMDQVGLSILASVVTAASVPAVASAALIKVAKDAIDALVKTDKPFRLFKQRSERIRDANFAIASCTEINDQVLLALATFDLKSDVNFTNVLFWEWNNSTVRLSRGDGVFTLNNNVYSFARDEVLRMLGENALKAIAKYSIS